MPTYEDYSGLFDTHIGKRSGQIECTCTHHDGQIVQPHEQDRDTGRFDGEQVTDVRRVVPVQQVSCPCAVPGYIASERQRDVTISLYTLYS